MFDYQATGVAGTPKLPEVSCYFDFGGEGGDRARFFFSGGPQKSIGQLLLPSVYFLQKWHTGFFFHLQLSFGTTTRTQ